MRRLALGVVAVMACGCASVRITNPATYPVALRVVEVAATSGKYEYEIHPTWLGWANNKITLVKDPDTSTGVAIIECTIDGGGTAFVSRALFTFQQAIFIRTTSDHRDRAR